MSGVHHAGCVARLIGGVWSGVLLTGPSGVGKSDLALRLTDRGWSLVADDRVHLWACASRLYARAPGALAGLLEARCVDVVRRRHRDFVRVDLIVDCVPASAELERMPEPRTRRIEGVEAPLLALRALEPSAPAKIGLALSRAVECRPSHRAF